jgi:orotidine-5'-phosphate decarboxylase
MSVVQSPIIVAIDTASEQQARDWFGRLDPSLCRVKIGKELFTHCGPSIVKIAVNAGFDVFLDLKFHDIPNTVAKAVQAAADLGVWMLNVHAQGGPRMLEAAAKALDETGTDALLIAVTLLTSMDETELKALGIPESPAQYVSRLARLAHAAGLEGVVCSAQEAGAMKQIGGANFLTVTPGIRLETSAADDQRRVMTPLQAISQGSDYLVIGRPITQADDSVAVLKHILSQLTAR